MLFLRALWVRAYSSLRKCFARLGIKTQRRLRQRLHDCMLSKRMFVLSFSFSLIYKIQPFNRFQRSYIVVFKHRQLRPKILKSLWSSLNAEFKEYSSADSMLKDRSTEDLVAFLSISLVRDLIERCPFWSSHVSRASGVDLKQIDEMQDFTVNSMALASSEKARVRNTMSALAYRLLFHSRVSHQDQIRPSHLGICISPDRLLNLQHNLGENFDSKVLC